MEDIFLDGELKLCFFQKMAKFYTELYASPNTSHVNRTCSPLEHFHNCPRYDSPSFLSVIMDVVDAVDILYIS